MRHKLTTLAVFSYVAICLAVDFIPHHGPPLFRYTGSDPEVHVWNIGWPLGTAIYDPRYGWHWGPEAFVVLPLQVVLLLVAITAWRLWRWSSKR
ncbi:hypothetical protein [Aeoliella mucimassa]|uniref:Uncharacterized protein n=1 Tax=Aeoliella mucimassa TaxID=2527972 RepID=A0A518AGP1_9BACT|nr:hypothetical protein [Aeoliella mucimassa]QDU53895.1 hypothetical protein Pan181_00730 [Aeoliella mucimassa]